MPADLPIAGWHERVALPDLGIEQAFAKLDTGADSSTLHARDMHVLGEGKERRVEFTPPLLRNQESSESWPGGGVRRVSAPLVEEKIVRSSNCEEETRFMIATRLRLGEEDFVAHFTLTSREGLRFPILIGRDALANRFVVDAGSAEILGAPQECVSPESSEDAM